MDDFSDAFPPQNPFDSEPWAKDPPGFWPFLLGVLGALLLAVALVGIWPTAKPVPVANEAEAIKIAESEWKSIYGADVIAGEKPFRATHKNGVWFVEGTHSPNQDKGGVAVAEISDSDGRILRIDHTR